MGHMTSFDDKKFKDRLDTVLFGQNFIHLPETSSTNDYGVKLVEKSGSSKPGKIDGALILADEQSRGRGRFNRDWASPPGGLWFTLILKTRLSPDKIPSITLLAAYSAADSLINDYGIDVTIKWPNDLYHGDYKFGGILSEGRTDGDSKFIVLGMGLNIDIDNDYFENLENKAVNIQELTREEVSPEVVGANDNLILILKKYYALKVRWPYRDTTKPRFGKYYFVGEEYDIDRIDYEGLDAAVSRYDPIFLSLSSRFKSRKELDTAENWMDLLIEGFCNEYARADRQDN